MDESDQILINSLIGLGLEVSKADLTFDDFSSDLLMNAAGLCLDWISEARGEPAAFPKSCPSNMAARYKVAVTLAGAIKAIGYSEPLGYQAFLYPAVRDVRRIVSFLVENLPKEAGPSVVEGASEASRLDSAIRDAFSASYKEPWLPHYCRGPGALPHSHLSAKTLLIPFQSDRGTPDPSRSDWFRSFPSLTTEFNNFSDLLPTIWNYERKTRLAESINSESILKIIKSTNESIKTNNSSESHPQIIRRPEPRKRTKFIEHDRERLLSKPELPPTTENDAEIENSKLELERIEIKYEESVRNYEDLREKLEQFNGKYQSLIGAQIELDREIESTKKDLEVKEKIGILLSKGGTSLNDLQTVIAKNQAQLDEIRSKKDANRMEIEKKIEEIKLKNSDRFSQTNQIEKELREIKLAMEECRRDYQQKDNEIRVLDEKVKQILKNPSVKQNRNDFTKRILELTENKKKQNREIRKILADIFVLQKEINSLRGKLDRSFKETSDCILEYSKKDEMSKKMYKVLLGIHENCSDLVGVIEEKGRLTREIRDIETNIENEDRENIEKNMEKITADLGDAKQNCDNLKKLIKNHKNRNN